MAKKVELMRWVIDTGFLQTALITAFFLKLQCRDLVLKHGSAITP